MKSGLRDRNNAQFADPYVFKTLFSVSMKSGLRDRNNDRNDPSTWPFFMSQ